MKIRKPCNLARLYAGPDHPILANSPELRFIQSICNGTTDEAVSLFHEKKLLVMFRPSSMSLMVVSSD